MMSGANACWSPPFPRGEVGGSCPRSNDLEDVLFVVWSRRHFCTLHAGRGAGPARAHERALPRLPLAPGRQEAPVCGLRGHPNARAVRGARPRGGLLGVGTCHCGRMSSYAGLDEALGALEGGVEAPVDAPAAGSRAATQDPAAPSPEGARTHALGAAPLASSSAVGLVALGARAEDEREDKAAMGVHVARAPPCIVRQARYERGSPRRWQPPKAARRATTGWRSCTLAAGAGAAWSPVGRTVASW